MGTRSGATNGADIYDWGDPSPSARNGAPVTAGRPAGLSDDEDSDNYDNDIYVGPSLKGPRPGSESSSYGRAPPPDHTAQQYEHLEPTERLRLACLNGKIDKVQELLDGGVIKVDDSSKTNGWSPLMLAASQSNIPLLKLLLDRGADVNFQATGSGSGLTPLMVSSLATSGIEHILESVQLLLEHGAGVNLANINGVTPLMFAAKENKLPLVKALLTAGANVNAVDRDGRSTLELAAGLGLGRTVRLLLEHNADASLINEFGQTAGDVASENGYQIISDILYRTVTTKWRPGLSPELLNQLVDWESKRSFATLNKAAETLECNERSQIEMVLENLRLQDKFKKFREHKISYLNFLNLDETQLKDIGIDLVGDRMKILDAIRDIHNREWVDQSITPIYLKSDITASEVICILNNTKKHMEYITATVQYLRKKSVTNPEMVQVGIEQSPLKDMVEYTSASLDAIANLEAEVKLLQQVLRQMEQNAEFEIPDAVEGHGRLSRGFSRKWTTVLGAITLAGIGFVFALRYRPQTGLQWPPFMGFQK